MQTDLDRERKTMTRLWAKREEQIHGVAETMAGLYGDLQASLAGPCRRSRGLSCHCLMRLVRANRLNEGIPQRILGYE
jgi:hypothetical protein